jgi:hypothetical protein
VPEAQREAFMKQIEPPPSPPSHVDLSTLPDTL